MLTHDTSFNDFIFYDFVGLCLEFYAGSYNVHGPNTSLGERLNPDGTPIDWSKTIDKIDDL